MTARPSSEAFSGGFMVGGVTIGALDSASAKNLSRLKHVKPCWTDLDGHGHGGTKGLFFSGDVLFGYTDP